MARIGAFERDLKVATTGLEPAQISRALAVVAKKALGEAIATGQASRKFQRYVDGRHDAPEESVTPAGVIVYEFDYLEEVVQFAMNALFELSPVDSGKYRSSHTIYLRDRPVRNLSGYKPGDEVVVLNVVPYSRKIEVGAMKMRVPSGVYEKARQRVLGRFGNFVRVEMKFVTIPGGYILKGVRAARSETGRKKPRRYKDTDAGQEMTYPALILQAGV